MTQALASRWTTGLRREVLPNGLTLLVQRDDSAPAVAVVTHVKAGFFDEPDRWIGISHVLEHMFFKGTPTRGPGAVARETKGAGGYLNAHTSYDHTAYYVVLPASELATALEIQSDALRNSLIDDGELARELQVIIQEVKRKRDTASAMAHETLHEVMFDRHWMRRWRIGQEEQLARFARDDVHGYYASRYVPDRTIVSIVGDIDEESALALARKQYGYWPALPGALDRSPDEPPRSGVHVRTLRGDVAQAELSLGWRAPPPLHADAPALDMAAAVLSAGRGSWLYRSLREPGIVTSVGAHYYAPTELGVFSVGAELEPEQLDAAIAGIAEGIARLSLVGPSADDLERARTLLLARWARRMESMEGRASALASAEALESVDLLDREYADLESVTAAEVRAAAARWLDPNAVSAVAYLPDARGSDLNAEAVARMFAVTALTPLAAPEQPPSRRAAEPPGRRAAEPPSRPAAQPPSHGILHLPLPGADLLLRRKRGVPMATLGIYVARATFDPPELAGIGALAVRTALRGADGLDAAALAFAFERLGGTLSPSVAADWAGLGTTVLAPNLRDAARLLDRVFQQPALEATAIDAERRILVAEAEQMPDDMLGYPFQLAFAAAFGDRGYGVPVSGLPETLVNISADAVRQWHRNTFLGARPVIIAVGDIDPDEAAETLAEIFSALPDRAAVARGTVEPWRADVTAPRMIQREKAQSAFAMVFPGPDRRDPRRHAADVWAAVASGLGGRLFEALRDRRSLAYTVLAAAWQRGRAGVLATYIAMAPEREDEAREEMLKELARFAAEPIDDVELQRAVSYLAGQAEVRRQSGSAVAGEILEAWLVGEGLDEITDPAAPYRGVTAEAVRSLAAECLDAGRRAEGIVRGSGGVQR